MPRTILYRFHRDAVLELMESQALRLVDLQRRTVEVDAEGRGVSLPMLSELLSEKTKAGVQTRTHTSLRTVRLVGDALGIKRYKAIYSDDRVAA